MQPPLAMCGILCAECPAYLATINDDDDLRAQTAAQWSKMFSADIPAEAINCLGCTSGSPTVFTHCQVCEIRACGQDKGLVHCGKCADFPCDKLDFVHNAAPQAKAALEADR